MMDMSENPVLLGAVFVSTGSSGRGVDDSGGAESTAFRGKASIGRAYSVKETELNTAVDLRILVTRWRQEAF